MSKKPKTPSSSNVSVKLQDCQEIIAGLYLGSAKAAKNAEGLKAESITHIVNIAGKEYHPSSFIYFTYHFKDSREDEGSLLNERETEEIFNFIDSALNYSPLSSASSTSSANNKAGKVLVHCMAGMSRSPSIVILYLMKRRQMRFVDALNLVKSKRGCIRINPAFLEQLISVEKSLIKEI